MQYGILGTTQALRDDGTPVPLGGPRLRALLAALVLRAGRPTPARALIEEIWADEPPADPQDALQTLVARLRRALGPDQVASAADGYRLVGTGGTPGTGHGTGPGRGSAPDSDLRRFELLAAAEDAASLRSALALWRGPALADLPTRADATARCEAQRDSVRLRLLTAELADGRAAEVLQELAGLVDRAPLDETLQELQLRALRDSGRAPEALVAYERFRHRLAEELGTDPGARLRALHAELLAPPPVPPVVPLRPTSPTPPAAGPHLPAVPPTPTAGPHTGTVPAVPPVPPGPHPSARPAPASTNLRQRLTSFVGRDADLAALNAELPQRRLLTLTGPGGSGKTRLAQQAAEALADHYPDGVWLVELAPLDDPQAVPGAVLSALGLRGTQLHVGSTAAALAVEARSSASPDGETPLGQLLDHCASRRLLLVLDNCEHLVQSAAELAERLTSGCPGVTLLATSREPLGVPGETVRPVEPLPDPAALRLLAERGAAARPGFDPTDPDQDPEACAEICRRLDGLPLAIELAAARLRALTPRQLADRLDGRFQLLSGGSRTHLPRQQTLRAVVDWSWDLLDKPERALLARLSVFAGGWTLEAAELICADGGAGPDGPRPAAEIATLLASLVDKSLVQASLDGASSRYRMLETIHDYARERLREDPSGAEEVVLRRHLVHFRELARTTDPLLRGADQLGALALLEAEHDNLRAALRRAVAARDRQEALCLVLSLAWFWNLRDFVDESRAWFAAVGEICPEGFPERPDTGPDATPDATAGTTPATTPATTPDAVPNAVRRPAPGPLDLPPPWSKEVLDEALRGRAVFGYITLESDFNRAPTEADVRFAGSVLAAYRPDLPEAARMPGIHRAFVAMRAALMGEMSAVVDGIVEGCRLHDRTWELAFALQLRCKLRNDQSGMRESALADAAESLALFTRLGDRWGMAEALAGQSEAAAFAGDFAAAARCAREAIGLARSVGADQGVPILRVRLGDALLGAGELAEGERQLLLGIEDSRVGGPYGQGAGFYGTIVLAALRARQGRLTESRELLLPMLETFGEGSMGSMLVGMIDGLMGWLDAQEGRPEEGLLRLRAGVAAVVGHPMADYIGDVLGVMLIPSAAHILMLCARAHLRVEEEPARLAARLIGACDSRRSRQPVHHLERRGLEETVAGLRELLGDDAYESARAEGTGLDSAAVLALLQGIND